MIPKFVISLDFELFWGVIESRSFNSYKTNVEGVWESVPKMLELFKKYNIGATWATVGMLMCKDFKEWSSFKSNNYPNYKNIKINPYNLGQLVKNNEKLFFAKDLVKKIIDYDNQEIASHTFSHYYCKEDGSDIDSFNDDISSSIEISSKLNINIKSIVFPRNQVNEKFFNILKKNNIFIYRGNIDSFLYRNGHSVPYGIIGRSLRLADSIFPISKSLISNPAINNSLINVPASLFLRPYNKNFKSFELKKINRIKKVMLDAAINQKVFHLWWHPHNFGINFDENFYILEEVLKYYNFLNSNYGMESFTMQSFKDLRL